MKKDYFSNHAQDYAAYRPDYPPALFSYLAKLVNTHELAWDCATGNGQAAASLAKYFNCVIATDMSKQQIQNATQKPNIEYRVLPAEKTNLENNSVDLLTVAQALHWFNLEDFYREAHRVLKPNGVIAAWCYALAQTTPHIDAVIERFCYEILGDYWPPERKYIDEKYQTIPFPFEKLITPAFFMEHQWNLMQTLNYLNTWSPVKIYIKKNQLNPIDLIKSELEEAWGNPELKKRVKWPIYLLVGYALSYDNR